MPSALELLRLVIVLASLSAWVGAFTGLLIWADNTTRKDENR
jgi:hypothetical protein